MDLHAPLSSLQWVDRTRLRANDYNPNKVSEDNLKLLTQSILTNGWTLPIVVRPDYTIIDGFHRWTVSGREPLLSQLGGKVPVVIVDHQGDESADVYGTITHNRARGTHLLEPMKAIVKKLMQSEFSDRLFLIERSGKLGLGTAYIKGFKWALEHDYGYVFEMDADFSHDPKDLPRLYECVTTGGNDVAVGSRYISGVNVVNWPMGRVLMSYYASKYVRFVTGIPVHDTTAGFVCYRRQVLEDIDLDAIRFKGYAFQIEMKFTAHKLGYKVGEVPVIFVNRQLGTSKMSGGIFSEALFGVMRLRWDSMTGKIRRKSAS